jgi:hypothetical protein
VSIAERYIAQDGHRLITKVLVFMPDRGKIVVVGKGDFFTDIFSGSTVYGDNFWCFDKLRQMEKNKEQVWYINKGKYVGVEDFFKK